MARKVTYTCASLLLWWISGGFLIAQTLKITDPKDGTVLNPGQTVTVVVDISPVLAFREIIVLGGRIGCSQWILGPPYRCYMTIPRRIRPRRYTLTADGTTASGKGATSDPVEISVERPDSPFSLKEALKREFCSRLVHENSGSLLDADFPD